MTKLICNLTVAMTFGALTMSAAQADKLSECERYGEAFFKRQGGNVSKIEIERGDSLYDNRFDDKVGSQYVSSEYLGMARLTSPSGVKRQRFVCLHQGDGKKPLYFSVFPE